MPTPYFVHPSAFVDPPCTIGPGTRIWHFSHVMPNARIGRDCSLGQNVHVAAGVTLGDNVKVQNNVSLYEGCDIGDDVFLGPSCVFTNVINPRSEISRRAEYARTRVLRGATIGANATIVCGRVIGRHAFIAAGAVVTRDVPDYALVMGTPARQVGWMGRHGYRLSAPDADGVRHCPRSGFRYREEPAGQLRCLDLGEDVPLTERPVRKSA